MLLLTQEKTEPLIKMLVNKYTQAGDVVFEHFA